MFKLNIEKILMPSGNYCVLFKTKYEGSIEGDALPKVDLSRTGSGTCYRIDQFHLHNDHASKSHTEYTVDNYIKRVVTDTADALLQIGEIAETDIEKVKLIPVPFMPAPSTN